MSDVISYLGYRGEALVFLDNEKYSFVSGRGLCVNDASGCSDILWRNDGISCYAAHVARGMVAFAAPSALKPIEVMDFQERQTLKSFENPSASEIIDMDFSRSGNKLYAISGVRNPKLIIWDFETEKVVVNLDLKQEHKKVLVNPGGDRMFALYGDKGVQVGLVNEISGIEYVKLETLNLESKKFFTEDSEEDKLRASAEANSITCCVWTPYDYLIIGNRAGKIAEALVVDRKSVAVLRKSILGGSKPEETTVATSAAISNGYCVVGSNVGTVYWFPMVTFGGQPNPDAALMDCRSPMQTTKVSGSVTAVAIDSYSRRVLIGTAHNGILTSQLDIQERHHEGDDMLEVSADDMHNAGPMEVETEHILETQAGAVLGSKAAAITITNSDVVPVFIAGAHDGSFAVWKHPQADSAAQERWDMQGGKVLPEASQLLCSYRVGLGSSPQTICSMDVLPFKSKMGTCLVAFGLSSGWVEVWELAGSMSGKDVAVTGTKLGARRLYESPIVSVAASTFQTGSGPVCALALASAMDPVVYVVETFSTPQNSLTFDVRNTFKVESGGPSALTWHGDSLLVADTKGTLSQFSSSNGVAGTNKLTFPRVETAWSVGDVNVVAATLAKAKVPEVVVLPASSNTFSFFSLGDVTKVTTGPAHESAIVSTAMSGSGTHLACGCVSGALYVWQRDAGDPAGWKLVAQEYVHADAVSSVCFSADSSLVFSCGIDGSYFVYKVKEAVYLKPDTKVMKLSESPPADVEFTTFANMPDTWMSKREAKAVELLRFQNRDNLAVLEKSLEEVREKHRALLAENDARSDLEKMELSEFVVDVQARDGLVEQNAASTSELFTAYQRSNALNELLAARVRAMCVDTMDSTSRPVLPILDKSKSAVVTSLAQRKYTAEEQSTFDKVRLLRAIEIRTQETQAGGVVTKVPSGKRRCAWSTSMAGMPETTEWVALEGVRWPCEDVVQMLADRAAAEEAAKSAKKAGGGGGDGDDKEQEEEDAVVVEDDEETEADTKRTFDDGDVFNLLYPPQAVRSSVQKRSQIVFLKEVNRLVRAKFNEHFEKLVGAKEDVLSATESRNARIKTIMGELKMDEPMFEPSWSDVEKKASALTVNDNEVVSRPYESEKDRAKRLAEEEERRRRDAEKDADNVFGRALDDMMDGVLSVKKDLLAEGEMVRPAWMDELDPKDMTELQLKELEEWDDKVKAHEEEQAKYKQALQIELKKLRQDNLDAAAEFDKMLMDMVKTKGAVQKELLSQELYVTRLAHSMARRDQAWTSLKKNASLLNATVSDRGVLRGKIEGYSVQVDDLKQQLNAAVEEDRALDKGFNRHLADATGQTYDLDSLKVFKTLYRMRTFPTGDNLDESQELQGKSVDGAGGVGESKDGGLVEMPSSMTMVNPDDPFYAYQLLKLKKRTDEANTIPLLEPLDERRDVPDNFSADQETFDALQELRFQKIRQEIEVKKLSHVHTELARKLELLTMEDAMLASMIGDLSDLREDTLGFLRNLESNVDVVVCLAQGNDEVDRDAVVTDYSNGLLIPTDVIDKFNSKVLEHGKTKIKVLARIKQFRRKINIIDWNAKHLTLQAKHYEEYFTDLQLLRVTRDLQSVIREGSNEAQAKARLDTMAQRKDFMAKSAEVKVGKLMKVNDRLARNVREKHNEMSTLQLKIQELRADVAERESVQRSRDAARGATGDAHATATAKMKKVVARRQLVDTARAQAEEIDYLRSELDKMRQRTFPSFAKAGKKF